MRTTSPPIMQPFHRPIKHAKMMENGRRNVDKDRCGQDIMSLVNFLLSSHCTVDKDILPGDIMKLRVYVGQLGHQIDPKATDKLY